MRWDRRQAEQLHAKIVHLDDVELSDDARKVFRETVHPLRRDDLARQQYVSDLIEGGSLLDVGVGRGVMVNLCGLSGKFDRIVGVDIKSYRPDRMTEWEYVEADVVNLPFGDGEFDTVCAMEIIEHLDEIDQALSELRRVGGRLMITVPFCEGEPMYRGHRQRFCADRLSETFPDGTFTVLVKSTGTAWVLVDR